MHFNKNRSGTFLHLHLETSIVSPCLFSFTWNLVICDPLVPLLTNKIHYYYCFISNLIKIKVFCVYKSRFWGASQNDHDFAWTKINAQAFCTILESWAFFGEWLLFFPPGMWQSLWTSATYQHYGRSEFCVL